MYHGDSNLLIETSARDVVATVRQYVPYSEEAETLVYRLFRVIACSQVTICKSHFSHPDPRVDIVRRRPSS